jgi:hypothetical protein
MHCSTGRVGDSYLQAAHTKHEEFNCRLQHDLARYEPHHLHKLLQFLLLPQVPSYDDQVVRQNSSESHSIGGGSPVVKARRQHKSISPSSLKKRLHVAPEHPQQAESSTQVMDGGVPQSQGSSSAPEEHRQGQQQQQQRRRRGRRPAGQVSLPTLRPPA